MKYLLPILLLFSIVSCKQNHDEAVKHRIKGKEYSMNLNMDSAFFHLRKAVELDPNYDTAYFDIGLIHFITRDIDSAIIYFQKSIDANPEYALAHAYKGLMQEDKPEIAIRCFQKSLEFAKKDSEKALAYGEMGIQYFHLKEYKKSASLIDSSFIYEVNEDDFLREYQGDCYYELKEYDKAIHAYRKQLEYTPENMRLYNVIAELKGKRYKYNEAVKILESGLRIEPNHNQSLHNIGYWMYEGLIDYPKALTYLSQVSTDYPSFLKTTYIKGKINLELGKKEDACHHFNQVIALSAKKGLFMDDIDETKKDGETVYQIDMNEDEVMKKLSANENPFSTSPEYWYFIQSYNHIKNICD